MQAVDTQHGAARSSGKRLRTLDLYSVRLGSLAQLVQFANHLGISALSMYSCNFRGCKLGTLGSTGITRLSVEGEDQNEQIDLEGLPGLAQLHHLRVGFIRTDNPAAIVKAVPPQIRILQFAYRNHLTLKALFEGCILDTYTNLRVFELQALDELKMWAEDRLDRDLPLHMNIADYASYLQSCSAALTALSHPGVRVMPTNILEILEACAVIVWGEGWRQQMEGGNAAQESAEAEENSAVEGELPRGLILIP